MVRGARFLKKESLLSNKVELLAVVGGEEYQFS